MSSEKRCLIYSLKSVSLSYIFSIRWNCFSVGTLFSSFVFFTRLGLWVLISHYQLYQNGAFDFQLNDYSTIYKNGLPLYQSQLRSNTKFKILLVYASVAMALNHYQMLYLQIYCLWFCVAYQLVLYNSQIIVGQKYKRRPKLSMKIGTNRISRTFWQLPSSLKIR